MACTVDPYYSWTLPSPSQELLRTERNIEDETHSLARQLLFECLSDSDKCQSCSGCLYDGALGVYVSLLDYALTHKNRSSIYKFKCYLTKVYDAAYKASEGIQKRLKTHPDFNSISVLKSEWVGTNCLLAISQHHLGMIEESKAILNETFDQILQIASHCSTKDNNTVLTGRSGALQALFWVRASIQNPYYRTDVAIKLSNQILQGGSLPTPLPLEESTIIFFPAEEENNDDDDVMSQRSTSSMASSPPKTLHIMTSKSDIKTQRKIRSHHKHNRNGASKGKLGILTTLLGLLPSEWDILEESQPECKELMKEQIDTLDTESHCQQMNWAYGASSLGLLWIRASQIFQDKEYLKKTFDLCESKVWPRAKISADSGNIGLAKGWTGVSFLFLSLAEHCQKPLSTLWKRRAEYLARIALTLPEHGESAFKYSLYHGFGGLASLLLQISASEEIKIQVPLYFIGHIKTEVEERDRLPPLLLVQEDVPNYLEFSESEDEELAGGEDAALESPLSADSYSTPCRKLRFDKPTYAVKSNTSTTFWSLQSESKIGSSGKYIPAMILSTPPSRRPSRHLTVRTSPKQNTPTPNAQSRPASDTKLPRTPSTRQTLTGSGAKVRLTRSAMLKLQSSTPTKTPNSFMCTTPPRILSRTNQSPLKISTENLGGSGAKVRLTRSAMLKLQSSTPTKTPNSFMCTPLPQTPSRMNQSPLKISTENLGGSGAKVRLNRSAFLQIKAAEAAAAAEKSKLDRLRSMMPPMNLISFLSPSKPTTSDLGDEMGHPNDRDKIGTRIVKTFQHEAFNETQSKPIEEAMINPTIPNTRVEKARIRMPAALKMFDINGQSAEMRDPVEETENRNAYANT
jgi:hypothetical protein